MFLKYEEMKKARQELADAKARWSKFTAPARNKSGAEMFVLRVIGGAISIDGPRYYIEHFESRSSIGIKVISDFRWAKKYKLQGTAVAKKYLETRGFVVNVEPVLNPSFPEGRYPREKIKKIDFGTQVREAYSAYEIEGRY